MPSPRPDKIGRSPLHYAANIGDLHAVTELLKGGSDPNLADKNGWSPLHFAAKAKSVAIVKLLINSGADIDARDSHGNTPLFTTVFNSRGEGEIIQILRAAGADPTTANHQGVSPVILARQIANYDVVRFFADLSNDLTDFK